MTDCFVISAGYNAVMPYDNDDIEYNPPFNATSYIIYDDAWNVNDEWELESYYSDITADWVPTTTRDKLSLIVNRPRIGQNNVAFDFPLDEYFPIGIFYHTQTSNVFDEGGYIES